MGFIISLINIIVSLIILLVFVYTLMGYFLAPYHPIRQTLGKIIEPVLIPIRRKIPPLNGLDLSPLILILILYALRAIILALLRSFS